MKAIQEYYDAHYAHCYGCGPANASGLQIRSYVEGDEVVMRYTLDPAMTGGVPDHAWGGILAAILDCHAAGAACAFKYHAEGGLIGDGGALPRFVTGTFTVVYRAPTPVGVELVARARPLAIADRKVTIAVELSANDVVCVTGEMIAIQLRDVR